MLKMFKEKLNFSMNINYYNRCVKAYISPYGQWTNQKHIVSCEWLILKSEPLFVFQFPVRFKDTTQCDNIKQWNIFVYLQEYVNKARDLERELRALTIEKTRTETMLEVGYFIFGNKVLLMLKLITDELFLFHWNVRNVIAETK